MRQLICFPPPSPPLPNLLSTKLLSDSHFNGVPYAISVRADGPRPNIVLDNLLVENSASVILVSGGETILPGKPGPPHTHTHLTHSLNPETFCLGGNHMFLYSGLTGEKEKKNKQDPLPVPSRSHPGLWEDVTLCSMAPGAM